MSELTNEAKSGASVESEPKTASMHIDVDELLAVQRLAFRDALSAALTNFLGNGGTPTDYVEVIVTLSDGCGSVGAGVIDEVDLAEFAMPEDAR